MKAGAALTSGLALVVCVVVGSTSSIVFAGGGYLLPRPAENHVTIEATSSYEEDRLESGEPSTRWNDTFVREKITFLSRGFFYHPRFLLYQVSLGAALSEEQYEHSLLAPGGWTHGRGPEYDVKFTLLPEHPYHLSLFASRYEPLFKEQAATRHDRVGKLRGVNFQYRRKPYFLHTGYTDESIGSGGSSSDVSKFTADSQYFKRYKGGNELTFGAAYIPATYSDSAGLAGNSTEYSANNLVDLRRVRLSSSLTGFHLDQQSPSFGSFKSDQNSLYEQLITFLPLSFRANLTYRYQNSDSEFRDTGAESVRALSSNGSQLQCDVIHRLYQSLDTTYTHLNDSRTTSGGVTTTVSDSLTLDYSKLIPHGRVLAGAYLSRVTTEGRGAGTDVINEPHSAIPVPTGSFVLNGQNVEELSILVFLKSPLPPFETVPLRRDENYTVTAVPNSNTFEIRVFNLPPEFAPSGTYDFLVFYRLTGGGYTLRPETFAGTTSVELFDKLLTPYFSYSAIRSEVLSGSFPGFAPDSTTYSAGLLVYRGPLRARVEYQRVRWELNPYEARRAEAQYVGSLTRTLRAYATASYLEKQHFQGALTSYAAPFTDVTLNVSGNIEKQVRTAGMSFSGGGSYSELQGLVDSRAYTATVRWNWTGGKLKLSVGVNAYRSETTGATLSAFHRDHVLMYVTLGRQIF